MKAFRQSPVELEEFIDFMEEDIGNVERVIGELMLEDVDVEFIVHAKAETVAESAENTEVEESHIIKTLIFMSEEPVAVLCPGDTSVSEDKLEEIIGEEVRMANPDEVEEATGYTIGGVSPFDLDIKVLMEESILDENEVKPAAGSRVVGVSIDSEALKEISGAEPVDVSRK